MLRNLHEITCATGEEFLFRFKTQSVAHSELGNTLCNAEAGQKGESDAQVVSCTFLSQWYKRLKQSAYFPWAILLLAGCLNVLAFAPFSISPLAWIAPALLLWSIQHSPPKQAFLQGWVYGMGFLGLGIHWMHISLSKFGGIDLLLSILLTCLFVLVMALYYGFITFLWVKLKQTLSPKAQYLLLFPAIWVSIEWLKSWFLSGFPWLSQGYSQISSPLAGYAPILGVLGISWVVITLSGTLLYSIQQPQQRPLWIGFIIGLYAVGYGLLHIPFSSPKGDEINVSLVQGNIQQEEKWEQDALQNIVRTYVQLTQTVWQSDLIIWPETAVPAFAYQMEDTLLTPLQERLEYENSAMLLGVPVWDDTLELYFNGMMNLSDQRETYYKRHLVPFGEYFPLKQWIRPLLNWLEIPMSNFSAGQATSPLLTVGRWQAAISICYEDAFGEETRQALPQAEFLINASNDAWFGDSIAPHQHLEIAQMRALETGRYMLRVTSTGITALIDHKGQEIDRARAFEATVLTGWIQPMQGSTPYVRIGYAGLLGILLLIFAFLFYPARKHP